MIRREVSLFLIVGGTTVLVDFASYQLLLLSGVLDIDFAKATSFLIGTIFAYFANRFWTFSHKSPAHRSIARFAVLYASTLAVNVGVNALALQWYQGIGAIQLAFLFATGTSAVLNFIGMKFFVFNHPGTSKQP